MIAITLENFQQIVLDESKNKLVLVAFWAQQIPESVELKNKLAVKTAPYTEQIITATVDCETQQQIAQQFGIQGLPTAVLVKDGQPIDGVSGPQTDETIATFLDKHLPKPEDVLLTQAQAALNEQNISDAQSAITQAHQLDEQRGDIKLVLIDFYIQTGKITEAQTLIDTIKMVDQDRYYQALVSKLDLASQAANSPEIQTLEAELAKNPNDINVQHQLASQYSQVNRFEDALKVLFRLVQSGEDATKVKSKELFLDVLKSLPEGDSLANKYRRKLYTLMY